MPLVINGVLPLSKRPTLGELQPLYEQTIRARSSLDKMGPFLSRVTEFLGEDREPKDVYKIDVASFEAWMHDKYNYSEYTIKLARNYARSWWSWMVFYEITNVNPWRRPLANTVKEYKYIADFPRL